MTKESNRGRMGILSLAVILAIIAASSAAVSMFQPSAAQNVTSTSNQTTANQTTANQTTANQTSGRLVNVTQSDLTPLRDHIDTAREDLRSDHIRDSFTALSSARNEI